MVNCTQINFQEFPECPSEPGPVPTVQSATLWSGNERDRKQVRPNDVDPVARLESFRALKC